MKSAPKPVTIRGVNYPSHSAAARALGVSASAVSAAVALGTQDHIGLGNAGRSRIGRRGNPITIGGVTYPSQSTAARALGVSTSTISRYRRMGVK